MPLGGSDVGRLATPMTSAHFPTSSSAKGKLWSVAVCGIL